MLNHIYRQIFKEAVCGVNEALVWTSLNQREPYNVLDDNNIERIQRPI